MKVTNHASFLSLFLIAKNLNKCDSFITLSSLGGCQKCKPLPPIFRYGAQSLYSISDDGPSHHQNVEPSVCLHHTALKTRNITSSIQFYNLLGFMEKCKFRAGPARAAWLEMPHSKHGFSRLELIEVPGYMLAGDSEISRQRSPNLIKHPAILGFNHIAIDVTPQIDPEGGTLEGWIADLNRRSIDAHGKYMRIALQPRQQIIGRNVYELAFMYDADGCLVELLRLISVLDQDMESGWNPWDGEVFVS